MAELANADTSGAATSGAVSSGAVSGGLRTLLRLEGFALLLAAVALYAQTGSSWTLFAILFLAPDLSFAFYLFGAVEGETDSRRLALRLVDEAGIGVAPGAAFGLGGEGYLRICFARAPDEMAEATRRFARWLARK